MYIYIHIYTCICIRMHVCFEYSECLKLRKSNQIFTMQKRTADGYCNRTTKCATWQHRLQHTCLILQILTF